MAIPHGAIMGGLSVVPDLTAALADYQGVPALEVEQPDHPEFKPTTTFGWGAYEFTVEDVFGWPERLQDSGFTIVGEPRELPGMDAFIPMQVLGTGREMVYLNQVFNDMANVDLPRAQSITDRIFIVILGTPSRAESCRWYQQRLGLEPVDLLLRYWHSS